MSFMYVHYYLPSSPDGVSPVVRLPQYENARDLIFTINSEHDLPNDGTLEASINGVKPDGNIYSALCTLSGNEVTVSADIQLTAAAGSWDAKIRIERPVNDVVYTARIHFIIDPDTLNSNAAHSDSVLDGIIYRCEQAEQTAVAAKEYIENYLESAVYGDEVYY